MTCKAIILLIISVQKLSVEVCIHKIPTSLLLCAVQVIHNSWESGGSGVNVPADEDVW